MKKNELQSALIGELKDIIAVLDGSEHADQIFFLQKVIESTENNNYDLLDSVELWGSSGSVWEIEISDQSVQKNYENHLLKLLAVMQKGGIMNKRARSVYDLLKIK